MRERLEGALQNPAAGRRQLARWLVEKDLPPRSGDEEPYTWVLRGLAAIDDYAPAECKLATWTAELIDEEPEGKRSQPDGDQYLHNLLRLAAALASPDELWEPLLRMYERRQLAGEYNNLNHRSSLLVALAKNQADTRLRDVWLRMAQGEQNSFLGGTRDDGLWALLYVPDTDKGRGYPDLTAVGEALSSQIIENSSERSNGTRQLVREACSRLLRLYPNQEYDLLKGFIEVADRNSWPKRATTALPTLFLNDRQDPNGYYAWRYYVEFLEAAFAVRADIVKKMCRDSIWKVRFSEPSSTGFSTVRNTLERVRQMSPLESERGLLGDLSHSLLELEHRSNSELASNLRRGRLRLLQRVVVIAEDRSTSKKIADALKASLPRPEIQELTPQSLVRHFSSREAAMPDIIVLGALAPQVMSEFPKLHCFFPNQATVIRLVKHRRSSEAELKGSPVHGASTILVTSAREAALRASAICGF